MITKEQFVEELDAIIEAQQKKQAVEDALDNYIRGFFHSIPDINEERAIKYLSALIGLEMSDDSPLMDWYYSPSRNGRINEDFIVSLIMLSMLAPSLFMIVCIYIIFLCFRYSLSARRGLG
jgi:hypothetical protein